MLNVRKQSHLPLSSSACLQSCDSASTRAMSSYRLPSFRLQILRSAFRRDFPDRLKRFNVWKFLSNLSYISRLAIIPMMTLTQTFVEVLGLNLRYNYRDATHLSSTSRKLHWPSSLPTFHILLLCWFQRIQV